MSKLKVGVCITSLGATQQDMVEIEQLARTVGNYMELGIYGDIRANDIFDSRSITDRLQSLKRASQNADIVIAWDGGFNAIELLEFIPALELDERKIFVGYSDNTVLVNALPAFGMMRGVMGPMLRN